MQKHTYVRDASNTQCCEIINTDDREVCVVYRGLDKTDEGLWKFDEYLQEKLAHLKRGRTTNFSVRIEKILSFILWNWE